MQRNIGTGSNTFTPEYGAAWLLGKYHCDKLYYWWDLAICLPNRRRKLFGYIQ